MVRTIALACHNARAVQANIKYVCGYFRWRRLAYGEGAVHLPKWEELPAETKQICEQFITYHIDKCIQDIVRDRR